jgi:hypothetical protein
LFVAIRVRLIGLIETIEGIGTIIFGTKMPGITLKVMFWELQSAPWKDWEREKYSQSLILLRERKMMNNPFDWNIDDDELDKAFSDWEGVLFANRQEKEEEERKQGFLNTLDEISALRVTYVCPAAELV